MPVHYIKRNGRFVAVGGKKKKSAKKKTTSRKRPNMFALAAKDKGYKAAKDAFTKAAIRKKKAWRKAEAKAKKKLRSMKYC